MNFLNEFEKHGYQIIKTEDGSPSLRSQQADESMHHSGGAYSETEMIYGRAIRATIQNIAEPRFLIVGLGLGYIEMLIAKECLEACVPRENIKIRSYESDPFLRQSFQNWLLDAEPNIYDEVLAYTIQNSSLNVEAMKSFLNSFFPSSLEEELTLQSMPQESFNCFLYDAFSSKASPMLWEETFLNQLLVCQSTVSRCYFSTYASKGSLKRVLKQNQFRIVDDRGFRGKRNSTFAERNQV